MFTAIFAIIALAGIGAGIGLGIQNNIDNKTNALKGEYNKADYDLKALQSEYNQLMYVDLPSAYSELDTAQDYLDNWDDLYAAQTGELENDIATYDDYLASWGDTYDQQVKSAEMQGKNDLSGLLNNWADSEVIAADRGAGGSMALIAEQNRLKAVDYAGDDMSLAGDDGLFGLSMKNLKVGLENNKSQAEGQVGVLRTNLGLVQTSLQDDYDDAFTAKTNWENTVGWLEGRKEALPGEITAKQNLMNKLKKEGGF